MIPEAGRSPRRDGRAGVFCDAGILPRRRRGKMRFALPLSVFPLDLRLRKD